MIGTIETLRATPDDRVLFDTQDGVITAGQMRTTAALLFDRIKDGNGPICLHTQSAALFTAALLAAAATRRGVILPAHPRPAYLAEIGVEEDRVVSDEAADNALRLSVAGNTSAIMAALETADQDLDLTFFTSGSSGRPKPVVKRLSQLEAEARVLDGQWGAGAGVVRATVSHQHIYGLLYRIVWPLMSGRVSSDEAAAVWESLAPRLGPDMTLISSPAHLTRLPPGIDFKASAPGQIFSSGQLLTPPAAQACREAFGVPAIEVLGSTETGGVAWRQQFTFDEPWNPFPAVDVTWSGDNELHVTSPWLPDVAPYPTGDRGEPLIDGRFELRGRADRVEKIDGRRISLTRVEEVLATLPEIETARALALPDRSGSLAAVMILTKAGREAYRRLGAFRLSRQLRQAAAGRLEPVELPKHWRFETELPTNSQGKNTLDDLRALFSGPSAIRAVAYDLIRFTDTEAEVSLILDPALKWFEGHFPDSPILPGIAQIHIVDLLVADLYGFRPRGGTLARVKFRQILRPNDRVVITLRPNPEARQVDFVYRRDEADVSLGRLGGT